MSKALKIVGAVVAIAAITVATFGIGTAPAIAATSFTVAGSSFAVAGVAATGASLFGLSVGALTAIAGGLSLASSLTGSTPQSGSSGGSQTEWKADPGAAIPYAIGRTLVAGNIVHRASYGGTDNPYQSIVTCYSGAGPVHAIDTILIDKTATTFGSGVGAASGALAGSLWMKTQLGAQPESSALAGPMGDFPGWSSSSKLSSHAASIMTMLWDKDGKKFPAGEVKPALIGRWVKAYDPRADSTYPGGSGAQRRADETTWAYTANPWLHALTWAIGRHSNGIRTLGVGMSSGIDVASFVEAANVADANAWVCGGVVSSSDDKWNVLKQMAESGGGFPMRFGSQLSAYVNRPRVALFTINEDDLAGPVKATAMQTRRARINGIIPRYRSEDHDWEIVPADVVRSATYLAEDRSEPKTREREFSLVQCFAGQAPVQASQLAAYAVADGREITPITVPIKVWGLAIRPGDAVTLNLPTVALNGQLAIVMKRDVDLATGAVTLALRSETTAKHAWALALTGNSPPSPALSAGNPGGVTNNLGSIPVDFANVTGSTKPANNATADLTMYDPVGAVYTAQGNTVTKTSGAAAWLQNAYSTQKMVGTAFVSAVLGQDTIIGLGVLSTGTVNAYATLPYSIDYTTAGAAYALENGASILLGSSYPLTTVWTITYDGLKVRYYADASLVRTVDASSNLTLQAAVAIYAAGTSVSSIRFGPYTDNVWANTGGTGRPSDNAGTSLVLTPLQAGGSPYPTIVGNTVSWVAGGGSWQEAAITPRMGDTVYISGRVANSATNGMIGLTSIASPTSSYTQLDYALFFTAGAGYQIYESSGLAYAPGGSCTGGDLLAVVSDGVTVRYYVNGGLFYTSLVSPAGKNMRGMVTSANADFKDLQCGPTSSNQWAATGGTGKPEDYATSADNMIANGALSSANNWLFSAGASWTANTSTANPVPGYISMAPSGGAVVSAEANNSALLTLSGVSKIFFSCIAQKGTGATGTMWASCRWYKYDGSASSINVETFTSIMPATSGGWVDTYLTFTPPSDAAYFKFAIAGVPATQYTYVSSIRVAKTEPSADVTMLVTGPTASVFAYTYTGTAKTGEFARDLNFRLIRGANVDITTSAAWSATTKTGSATYTIGSATGTLNVTALASDAVIEVSATYQGITRKASVTLTQNVDAPPTSGGGGSGGGGSSSTSTIAATTSTSYGSANTSVLTCVAGSGGQVACSFPATFKRTVNGNNGAYGKWQWRVVGGTFADITSEIHSTVNCDKDNTVTEPYNNAGSISVAMTKTGLTNGTTYEFQLLLRNDDAVTVNWFGTASTIGS